MWWGGAPHKSKSMCRGDCTLFWLGNPPLCFLYLGVPPQKIETEPLVAAASPVLAGAPPPMLLIFRGTPQKIETEPLAAAASPVLAGEPPALRPIFRGTPRSACVLQCGQQVGLWCAPGQWPRSRCFFLPPAPLCARKKRMVEIRFGAKPCPAWLSGSRHFFWSRFGPFPPSQALEILNLDHSFCLPRLVWL